MKGTMNHLTQQQLAELRQILEQKRESLSDYQRSEESADPANDPERLSTNESGEEALEAYEMLESEALTGATKSMLEDIEAALVRMDEGTYGLDEETGEPIPYLRLKLFPWARTTVRQ